MSAPFAAVIGWPAAHSLSPLMMTTWLNAAGIAGHYGLLEIPEDRFEAVLRRADDLGLSGLNVTVPYKARALALADTATDTARTIGAANLLTFEDGAIHADNTDIAGVAAALQGETGNGPAVVFGAGGAARAALHHLKQKNRLVRIVNRTLAHAHALADSLEMEAEITGDPVRAMAGAHLVINATSLGMAAKPELDVDFSVCAPGALAFDMVYTPLRTGFLKAAEAAGCKTADGLTMLIGQARPSFEAFFGAPPPESEVRAVLEHRLGQEGAP